jgi:hypothetical protein
MKQLKAKYRKVLSRYTKRGNLNHASLTEDLIGAAARKWVDGGRQI